MISIDLEDSGSKILCATRRTVYLSEDAGGSWRAVFRLDADAADDADEEDAEEETQTIRTERESFESETDQNDEFDRDDYDADDLYYLGVLEEDEDMEDVSDEELLERLLESGVLEESEEDEETEAEDASESEDPERDEEESRSIRDVCWNPGNPRYAYIATDQGLFLSTEFGRRWEPADRPSASRVTGTGAVCIVSPEGTVLTAQGHDVQISFDHGRTFRPLGGLWESAFVRDLETDRFHGRLTLIATDREIIVGEVEDSRFQLIRTIGHSIDVHSASVSPAGGIFIADQERLYHLSAENDWVPLNVLNLEQTTIRDIACTSDRVLLATNRGVLEWDFLTGDLNRLNPGLMDLNVREIRLNLADPEEVWIATGSGIFQLSGHPPRRTTPGIGRYMPIDYPEIDQIIRASLIHAQIDVVRDRGWLPDSKRRSWYPQVEFSYTRASIQQSLYSRTPEIWFDDGVPYKGPFTERFDRWENDPIDLQLSLSWRPALQCFDQSMLLATNRLRIEMACRQETMNMVQDLYSKLDQLYMERTMTTETAQLVYILLRIEKTEALLNALTGFEFDSRFRKGPGKEGIEGEGKE